MNTIDFSHPGGFPLTQDELNYLQQAYIECIGTLAGAIPSSTPILISGMGSSFFIGITTIAPGYFIYNGEIYYFTGGSFGGLPIGSGPIVLITDNTTTLTYYDTSVFPALHAKTASLYVGASITDATHFPLGNLLPYSVALGLAGRDSAFTQINFSSTAGAGTINSSVFYKKNYITNTLQLYGVFLALTPQDFAAAPAVSNVVVATLPLACRPATAAATFSAHIAPGGVLQQNATSGYFSMIDGYLATNGQVSFNFIQMVAGALEAGEFNCILPLD